MSKPIKLSPNQLHVLRLVKDGTEHESVLRTRSHHAGRLQTLRSLRKLGFVVLTDFGHGCTTLGSEWLARNDPRRWRAHPFMFVIGCIDSNGAITANASRENRTHRREESRGARWRWNIHAQEFSEVLGGTGHMTDEEIHAVRDWLIARGFTA